MLDDPLKQDAAQETPKLYFNSFGIAVGTSDFSMTLMLDNRPLMELKASYTVGKTLAAKLQWAVDEFEKATAYKLLTTEEVKEKLAAHAGKQNPEPK